jgi:hypothetical protein
LQGDRQPALAELKDTAGPAEDCRAKGRIAVRLCPPIGRSGPLSQDGHLAVGAAPGSIADVPLRLNGEGLEYRRRENCLDLAYRLKGLLRARIPFDHSGHRSL